MSQDIDFDGEIITDYCDEHTKLLMGKFYPKSTGNFYMSRVEFSLQLIAAPDLFLHVQNIFMQILRVSSSFDPALLTDEQHQILNDIDLLITSVEQ